MSQTALKSDTLHENLVRELSRMAPGEKFMTVRDIMRRYNVSQLIVDRAVNRLCEDGKLVSFARRGLFVPQFVCPAPAEQPTLLVAVPDWVSCSTATAAREVRTSLQPSSINTRMSRWDA